MQLASDTSASFIEMHHSFSGDQLRFDLLIDRLYLGCDFFAGRHDAGVTRQMGIQIGENLPTSSSRMNWY